LSLETVSVLPQKAAAGASALTKPQARPNPCAMQQETRSPLLVFDLDGTLADTAADLVATLNFILAREGLRTIALPDARPMVGGGTRALIQRGLAANAVEASGAQIDAMLADFMAHYEARIAENTVLFPGVTDALGRFEAAGFGFAVCTNKHEHASILLLRALGIETRFRAICGKDTFGVSKPDGEALLRTIARAGGDADSSIMIGDSKIDIDTARNAGVPVVAVNFGYSKEPVDSLAPDRVIGHYGELWDAVAELRNGQRQSALTWNRAHS
jgi:phosphoglycolate phosphatase